MTTSILPQDGSTDHHDNGSPMRTIRPQQGNKDKHDNGLTEKGMYIYICCKEYATIAETDHIWSLFLQYFYAKPHPVHGDAPDSLIKIKALI